MDVSLHATLPSTAQEYWTQTAEEPRVSVAKWVLSIV
eukprot:CAMPEP_0196741000 /NCGR_PEP_ID=MMETSP1091-20130531/37024_1 /TAXON_ID=302021 /ORGANISM="Rhodomonas sp., Strain CCMP768" /LENGTH=36 /DNA_ID= /DNA_START= /DNA_END= /DNA_ORIENTATION=